MVVMFRSGRTVVNYVVVVGLDVAFVAVMLILLIWAAHR
jgi:hypothetical protein